MCTALLNWKGSFNECGTFLLVSLEGCYHVRSSVTAFSYHPSLDHSFVGPSSWLRYKVKINGSNMAWCIHATVVAVWRLECMARAFCVRVRGGGFSFHFFRNFFYVPLLFVAVKKIQKQIKWKQTPILYFLKKPTTMQTNLSFFLMEARLGNKKK